MPYRIEFKPAAEREFRKLSRPIQQRIAPKIRELGNDPRPPGSKKLVGEQGFYRVRIGDYRVIYQIRDNLLLVLVLAVRHRSEAY